MPDNLTPRQRSYCMSRVRNKGTDLERALRSELRKCGVRFRGNMKSLPGSPDIVIPERKTAIFVDGDFWHGYRFGVWKDRVSPFWRRKIKRNIVRDRSSFRRVRRLGWRVVRLWQHEIEWDISASVQKIVSLTTLGTRNARPPAGRRRPPRRGITRAERPSEAAAPA